MKLNTTHGRAQLTILEVIGVAAFKNVAASNPKAPQSSHRRNLVYTENWTL